MDDTATLQTLTVREVLRARTTDLHEALHLHSSFVALFNQTSQRDDYRDLMQRLYGFYAPLDAAIERTIATLPPGSMTGFRYDRRSDHMARDLFDLGFTPAEIGDTPHCQALHDMVDPGSLIGVLYVIEGATLGGSRIDRAAQKLLEHDQPDGRRFWSWCRTNSKTRWSMISNLLDETPTDDASLTEMTAGALGTFSALADWLAPLDRPQTARVRARA